MQAMALQVMIHLNLPPNPYDEEKGPALVFADQTQSIFLSDMNGDGIDGYCAHSQW